MSIRYYDEAIVQKLQKWIKDPNMVILKPNEVNRLWQIRADQQNDKPLTLPLIAVSRDSSVGIKVPTRRELSSAGDKLNAITTYDEYERDTIKGIAELNAIPIDISYQIDIYTRRYEEGDEYLRNFIFNFVNHPKMTVSYIYNGIPETHTCYTLLDPTATDNSDISEHLFADEFTRWTLKVTITDAFLWSMPIKPILEFDEVVLGINDTAHPVIGNLDGSEDETSEADRINIDDKNYLKKDS